MSRNKFLICKVFVWQPSVSVTLYYRRPTIELLVVTNNASILVRNSSRVWELLRKKWTVNCVVKVGRMRWSGPVTLKPLERSLLMCLVGKIFGPCHLNPQWLGLHRFGAAAGGRVVPDMVPFWSAGPTMLAGRTQRLKFPTSKTFFAKNIIRYLCFIFIFPLIY
jgi:hypothetical protein